MAVRVVLDKKGVGQILNGPGVRRDMARRAANVASVAGPGHGHYVEKGRDRYRAAVYTDTQEAKRSQANRHTLSSAIDAARP